MPQAPQAISGINKKKF